jgi:peptidoglycan/xylan/chitin deacetylase (PgdA/CDA1 family)
MTFQALRDTVMVFGWLAVLAAVYLAVPYAVKVFLRSRFSHAASRSGCKFLTFDDGPDPLSTPQILDILDEFGVKATFFVVGQRAEEHPLIVRSIILRGHEIGEHGYAHLHPWMSWPGKYARELMRSGRAIGNFISHQPHVVFRPPYGKLNLFTLIYVLFTRRRIAFWDIDPRDYENADAKSIADDILKSFDSGSVVLLHDGRIDPGTNGSDLTVQALKLVLGQVTPDTRFRTLGALREELAK